MQSTQLSESLNSKLKTFVKFDHDIVQFLTHFDRLVMEKRCAESDSIFDSREKLPREMLKRSPLLSQVAELYTLHLFDLFHKEVDMSLACKVRQHHEFGGKFKCVIRLHNMETEFLVSGNVEVDEFGDNICRDVHCTCRKFEKFGILCGHALKGLGIISVMEISKSYILHRWRLDAKACAFKESKVNVEEEEEDPKLAKAGRYRNLCPKMVKLCARSCQLKVAYEFVNTEVESICAKVDKMFLEVGDSVDEGNDQLEVVDPKFKGANGLKKKVRVNSRNGKRLKPWYEKNGKRKKVNAKPISLDQNVPVPYVPEMRNCEFNLAFQISYIPEIFEVTRTKPFLEDEAFFELLSDPQKSRGYYNVELHNS